MKSKKLQKTLITNGPIEFIPIGITIREFFAAMAMQGYLAKHSSDFYAVSESVAKKAIQYADALIEELNK